MAARRPENSKPGPGNGQACLNAAGCSGKNAALAMDGSAAVNCERQDAAAHQRKSPPGPGWPGGRKVAGTGTEQARFHSGNQQVVSVCDAECDAISTDRIEVLARAVVLVAGMNIPEAAREAVLALVVDGLTKGAAQSEHSPGTRREGPGGHTGRHPSVRSASR